MRAKEKKSMREWVAKFNYPQKETAYFGGRFIAETEREAEALAFAAWKKIFPIDPPRVFIMIPGHIRISLDD